MPFWITLILLQPSFFRDHPPSQLSVELERRAEELYHAGDYDAAERLQRRALQSWKDMVRTQPLALTGSHYRLGRIYLAQGRLRNAERHAVAASAIATCSGPSPATCRAIWNLFAQIRFQQGRHHDAARYQEEVVGMLEGDRSGALAQSLNDLAMIRAAMGEFRIARSLLQASVDQYRRYGSAAGSSFGEVLGNLALVCTRENDYGQAEILYREAIHLTEEARGPNHAHLGIVLAEYGALLKKMGRTKEARTLEVRAQNILEYVRLPGMNSVDASQLRKQNQRAGVQSGTHLSR